MKKAILGKKLGMTQVFTDDGSMFAITVIEAGPCTVVQKKTKEKEGYDAVQVGFMEKRDNLVNKPMKGHFAKANAKSMRYLKEFRLEDCSNLEVGGTITADVFASGEKVDVSGVSKGKGFSGAVKRWGSSRGRMSHGGGPVHRHVGSMSANSSPGRVFKLKKMAGHMGAKNVTAQNIEIYRVDTDRNLILVKGAVPGPKGGLVTVRNTSIK